VLHANRKPTDEPNWKVSNNGVNTGTFTGVVVDDPDPDDAEGLGDPAPTAALEPEPPPEANTGLSATT
jgi:hypothetical protein